MASRPPSPSSLRPPSRPAAAAAGRMQRLLNCQPSPQPERQWSLATARSAGLLQRRPALSAVPAAVDLRARWWPAGDQGDTGSCVGWGTADGVLRWHFVQAGRLKPRERLSVRQVWMGAKEIDAQRARPSSFIESDGTWLTAGLDVARKHGVVTDSVLPFALKGGARMYAGEIDTFYALAAQRRIASWFSLGLDLAAWRQWLAEHGPILARVNVDQAFMDCRGPLDGHDVQDNQGGHCVAIVGWLPGTVEGASGGRFVVRNSWGTDWGEQGHALAAEAYVASAFTEAYGVTL